MAYTANKDRYQKMIYNRCGNSGLKLPAISLGLWHNFGSVDNFENAKDVLLYAFDNGITHFDLANNYGPEPGSAETNFGQVMAKELAPYRDELVISTKAGYDMWEGPYGNFGSRKYMLSSLDQSLKRLGLDYVDIFYSHRPDPDTSLEETMLALDHTVRQGKALYVGLSNYNAAQTLAAEAILKELKTPFIIHQPRYNMMDRWVEDGLLDALQEKQKGSIAFSPLEQGLLTDRYLNGVPQDSRMAKEAFLKKNRLTNEMLDTMKGLNDIAIKRGQSLAQMAISWLLKDERVTSVLVGASSTKQLSNNLDALNNLEFSADELALIEKTVTPVIFKSRT